MLPTEQDMVPKEASMWRESPEGSDELNPRKVRQDLHELLKDKNFFTTGGEEIIGDGLDEKEKTRRLDGLYHKIVGILEKSGLLHSDEPISDSTRKEIEEIVANAGFKMEGYTSFVPTDVQHNPEDVETRNLEALKKLNPKPESPPEEPN